MCIYKKERCTPEYIGHIQRPQSGKSIRKRNKKPLPISLNMIPTNLQNQSKALGLPLCTSQPKLIDNLGTTILTYSHDAPYFQMSYGFSPSTKSKKCIEDVRQTFFHFLPTKEPCQLKIVSRIVEGSNLTTKKKRENNNCLRTLDIVQ